MTVDQNPILGASRPVNSGFDAPFPWISIGQGRKKSASLGRRPRRDFDVFLEVGGAEGQSDSR
jgi:hypothetical protein